MKKNKHFFVNENLQTGGQITCPKALWQRLTKVLRLPIGSELALLNGRDGLFLAILGDKILHVREQLQTQSADSGVTLIVSLVKKPALDHILRQATECGVLAIQPVITEFVVADKLNTLRAEKIIVEAVEQCERLTIPGLKQVSKLQDVIASYDVVYWANEMKADGEFWPSRVEKEAAVLVGPEGGFSAIERQFLSDQKHVVSIGLGPHILRSDTAVTAALCQYQMLRT